MANNVDDHLDLGTDELNYDEEEEEDELEAGAGTTRKDSRSDEGASRRESSQWDDGEKADVSEDEGEAGEEPVSPEEISQSASGIDDQAVPLSDAEEGEVADDDDVAGEAQNGERPGSAREVKPKEPKPRPEDLEEGELSSDDGEVCIPSTKSNDSSNARPAIRPPAYSPEEHSGASRDLNNFGYGSSRDPQPADYRDRSAGGSRDLVGVVCKFHMRGDCHWGDTCRFYHPPEPERSRLRLKYQTRSTQLGGLLSRPPPLLSTRSSAGSIPSLLVQRTGMRTAPAVLDPMESAWERGLRQAREAVKAKQEDGDENGGEKDEVFANGGFGGKAKKGDNLSPISPPPEAPAVRIRTTISRPARPKQASPQLEAEAISDASRSSTPASSQRSHRHQGRRSHDSNRSGHRDSRRGSGGLSGHRDSRTPPERYRSSREGDSRRHSGPHHSHRSHHGAGKGTTLRSLIDSNRRENGDGCRHGQRDFRDRSPVRPRRASPDPSSRPSRIYDWRQKDADAPAAYSKNPRNMGANSLNSTNEDSGSSLKALRERLRRNRRSKRSESGSSGDDSDSSSSSASGSSGGRARRKERSPREGNRRWKEKDGEKREKEEDVDEGIKPAKELVPEEVSDEDNGGKDSPHCRGPKTPPTMRNEDNDDAASPPPPPPPLESERSPRPVGKKESKASKRTSVYETRVQQLRELDAQIKRKKQKRVSNNNEV